LKIFPFSDVFSFADWWEGFIFNDGVEEVEFLAFGLVGAVDGKAVRITPTVSDPVELILFGWVFGLEVISEKLPVLLPVFVFEGRVFDGTGWGTVVIGVKWLVEKIDVLGVL